MKVYIIGVNIAKYTMLKKIIDHLIETYLATVDVVDWLSKKNIDAAQYENGDFYIYVEVEPLFDSGIYMTIDPDEDKKSIVAKFKEANELLRDIMVIEPVDAVTTIDTSIIADGTIRTDLVEDHVHDEIVIKKYTGKKSSLTGITVEINGEQHYISKEDFQELRELDTLLKNNNMVLKEIVVDNQND
jgi:hypothetical protein